MRDGVQRDFHLIARESFVEADSRVIEKVRPAGLEPTTGGLENRCSIRLSYGRK